MSEHRGWLTNRRIYVERDFGMVRYQRFHSWWDNPYGTRSHEGRYCTFVGAIIGAVHRKIRAEFREWQRNRPVRTWRIP